MLPDLSERRARFENSVNSHHSQQALPQKRQLQSISTLDLVRKEADREPGVCPKFTAALEDLYSKRVAAVVEQALNSRSPFAFRTSAVSVES